MHKMWPKKRVTYSYGYGYYPYQLLLMNHLQLNLIIHSNWKCYKWFYWIESLLQKTIHCVICKLDLSFLCTWQNLINTSPICITVVLLPTTKHYSVLCLLCSSRLIFLPLEALQYSVTDPIYTCPIHWSYSGMMVFQLTCSDWGFLSSPGRDFRHSPDLLR